MSELANAPGSKVVISPDKMRAWVNLPKPAGGVKYTAEAIEAWLPQNGVVYGADRKMIEAAINSGKYDDLLEVARGKNPVSFVGGSYTLKIDKKPFTGLRASGDGSLIYDDLSFLQEAHAGDVLAEVVPPVPEEDGMTVTGEVVKPRPGTGGKELSGTGYAISEDGHYYTAPSLSHVSIVNEQLVVTPLKKLESLSAEDGPLEFEGNVLIEKDVTAGAQINATGSVFVAGRTVSATITAGNNVLLSGGMRADGGGSKVDAKGSVWGLFFESCEISTGGELCANHLTACEAKVGGRAAIIGGRAAISRTHLEAKSGVVVGTIDSSSTIIAGMDHSFIDNYNNIVKKSDRLTQDIQGLQQNISAHERINRMKPDKGKNDPAYKDMVAKLNQSLSVLTILQNERTRMKRTLEQMSTVNIIVREVIEAGAHISIDTRTLNILSPMQRTRFRRVQETVEATAIGN